MDPMTKRRPGLGNKISGAPSGRRDPQPEARAEPQDEARGNAQGDRQNRAMRALFVWPAALAASLSIGAASGCRAVGANVARGTDETAKDVSTDDFVAFPAAFREAVSPDGHFVFSVRTADAWQSRHARGRLVENAPGGPRVVWDQVLPQEYGPRYFLVGNQGQIVLFDESINVKSRYAVVLMNYKTSQSVVHDFAAVARTLELPAASIVERAKSGWWLAGAPSIDAAGTHARAPAGGRFVLVDLSTGRLSLSVPAKR